MSNKMITVMASVAALAVAVSYLAGTLGLHLSTGALTAFCFAMAAIAAAGAGVVMWMRTPKDGEAASDSSPQDMGPASAGVSSIMAEAETRLRRIQATFDTRPAVFVIGPVSSSKTSTLLNCGIDAEPLAGQSASGGKTVPTQLANLMLMRDAIALDASGAMLNDPTQWKQLLNRFRPRLRRKAGEAPRSALVCIPCEELMSGAEPAARLAQTIRARLDEATEAFGVRLPVYVLFTRTDRVPFFAEYVASLTNQEALDQVLGASFPMPAEEAAGLHADESERKFGGSFDALYQALAAGRLEQLARTEAMASRPGVYEFPREFRKLRAALVTVLTAIDRPARLMVAPFVRGFYFSGVRPIVVESVVNQPAPSSESTRAGDGKADATSMFRAGGASYQAPQRSAPVSVRSRVPQWLFLRPLFDQVVLADSAARTISAGSVHVNSRLRFLFAALIAFSLIAATLITISLIGNRGLLGLPQTAGDLATATTGASTAVQLASVEQLRELEALRAEVAQLYAWRDQGRPFSLGWGLYAGEDIRPSATRIYFRRFQQLMWGQIRYRNDQRLRSLPAARRETDEYAPSYDALKAHLVMTSEHRRPATEWSSPWLAGWLLKEWNSLHPTASPEQKELAQRQIDFYATRLREENPFPPQADSAAVGAARTHLSSFSNIDQIYNRLRAQAAAASEPVRFPVAFPEAAAFVTNNYTVDGAWTTKGWAAMAKSLREAKFAGEEWVLGQRTLTIQNPERLRADLLDTYRRDYIEQWTQYLKRTSVVSYRNPADAASKLRVLSQANTSPLLASLWLASQHTSVDDLVRKEFGSVHAVVAPAPDGSRNFISPTSQQYTAVLSNLAAAIEAFSAGAVPDQAMAATQMKLKASEARSLVANISGVLPRGTTDAVARGVASVLEQPITSFDIPDPARAAAAGMNGAGKAFCTEWSAISGKYPIAPKATSELSTAELSAFFSRPAGKLAKLETALAGAVQFNGGGWVANPAAPIQLNPVFIRFFDAAARLSRAMFPADGMTEPQLRFTLGWQPSDQITSMTVALDGQTVTFPGQTPGSKSFIWTGSPSSQFRIKYVLAGGSPLEDAYPPGTWSVFRFLDDAKRSEPTAGGMRVTWVVSAGSSGRAQMVGGKDLTYQFAVEPAILTRDALTRLACVSQVTLK